MKAKQFLIDNGFVVKKGRKPADQIKALNEAIEKFGSNIFEDYTYTKPKDVVTLKAPSITSSVSYMRAENTIRIIDTFGTTIQVDHCQAGHSVRRCSCKEVQPTKFLMDIAESWSLVVR